MLISLHGHKVSQAFFSSDTTCRFFGDMLSARGAGKCGFNNFKLTLL